MSKKILVILGHPDENTFCERIAKTYVDAAKKLSSEVNLISLNKIKFDPILWKGYREKQDLESDLIDAQKIILESDHIVIVYPTWWGVPPALLKGFIDRVFLPNYAFKSENGEIPKGLLKGKTARIITTMDSPLIYYRFMIGAPGTRMLKKGTLNFCGIKPVYTTHFYSLRTTSEDKRLSHLKKVQALVRKDMK